MLTTELHHNPRRASAINRHGVVTKKDVQTLTVDLDRLKERIARLSSLMDLSGVSDEERVKIDGARKWQSASQLAESFLGHLETALLRHQLGKRRGSGACV